jgi:F-type H+-transporting ATPase subunit a
MFSESQMENAASTEAHGEAAAKTAEQSFELPSFLDFMGLDMHHEYWGFTLHDWLPVIMSFLVGLLLVGFSLWATRRMEKIPRGSQAFVEIVVDGLYDFLSKVLGNDTARYLPFLGTTFLYIILMNFWGLIPLMHSPTNTLNTTLALAIVVFVYYNVEGIRIKGFKYFKHYVEPLFLAPLMLPIHIIGDLARPLSLSVRLFGNLTGEDLTLALLVMLTPFIFGLIPVPIHLVMVILALLFSTVQATVFTLLSSVYLSLAIEEDESH